MQGLLPTMFKHQIESGFIQPMSIVKLHTYQLQCIEGNIVCIVVKLEVQQQKSQLIGNPQSIRKPKLTEKKKSENVPPPPPEISKSVMFQNR